MTDSLFVSTALRTATKALNLFNHCTFLLDDQWNASADMATLPVCFFHTVSVTEEQQNQVAQQKIIAYTERSLTETKTEGVQLSMIADNIIKQPKSYKLEIIIPSSGIENFFLPIMRTSEALSDALINLSKDTDLEAQRIETVNMSSDVLYSVVDIVSVIESVFAGATASTLSRSALNAATQITQKILQTAKVMPRGDYFNSLEVPYNKNSLDAMAQSGHLLTMKTWDSWDYKKVVITECSITKEGEDGDTYKANVTLQELPLVVITSNTAINPAKKPGWWITASQQAVGNTIKAAVELMGGIGL